MWCVFIPTWCVNVYVCVLPSHTLTGNESGFEKDAQVEVHSALDVEGHLGLDDRFYLLDMTRTFPPTWPDPHFEKTPKVVCNELGNEYYHLYQFFRAEFIKR
jgi:Clustered mitochondria